MKNSFSPAEGIKSFFRQRSALSNLIVINALVFVLLNFIDLLFWLYNRHQSDVQNSSNPLVYWLSVPADSGELLLRPWGVFTYMFVHQEFLHILFNMITLYFGGQIFLRFLNEKKLVSTYILGGLTGALFFILSYNIFPVFKDALPSALAIGASASVLAVLVAAASYAPDFEVIFMFLGRVKLKYIALGFILLDLMSISKENPGGHLAHLGGASWGFIYIRFFLNKGWKGSSFGFPRNLNFKRKPFKKTYYNSRPITDEEFNAKKNEQQQQIDQILDKIAKHGYDGLSKTEKEILFKAGKK